MVSCQVCHKLAVNGVSRKCCGESGLYCWECWMAEGPQKPCIGCGMVDPEGCKPLEGEVAAQVEALRKQGLDSCRHGCGVFLPSEQLAMHETEQCPSRLEQCEHCGTPVKMISMGYHVKTQCEQAPIPCPQGCSADGIAKSSLTAHLTDACPNSLVNCEFCDSKITRAQLADHMTDSLNLHMLRMKKELCSLGAANYLLEQRITTHTAPVQPAAPVPPQKQYAYNLAGVAHRFADNFSVKQAIIGASLLLGLQLLLTFLPAFLILVVTFCLANGVFQRRCGPLPGVTNRRTQMNASRCRIFLYILGSGLLATTFPFFAIILYGLFPPQCMFDSEVSKLNQH